MDNLKIRIDRGHYDPIMGPGLYLFCEAHGGHFSYVEDITMRTTEEGECAAPLRLPLDRDSLQSLADDLWDMGIKPSQGHGSVGQIGAMGDHLKDMRAIVAKFTKTNL